MVISYKDFQKVELKVGTIISAEDHPNADKLQVLRVDVGEDAPRTTVAGLKGHYEAAELVGKTVVVVTNLEPAMLRGVESQGMVLAAQQGGKVVLLALDREIAPGSSVL